MLAFSQCYGKDIICLLFNYLEILDDGDQNYAYLKDIVAEKALKLFLKLGVLLVLVRDDQKRKACLFQKSLCAYSIRQQNQRLDNNTLDNTADQHDFIGSFKTIIYLIYPNNRSKKYETNNQTKW